MRDLEIRGTGDILGTRQHGNIAAVGFHLYTRLLAGSVARLRSEQGLPPDPTAKELELGRPLVSVDLPFDVNIPPDYVSDKNMRLRLYRRIASLGTQAEVEAIEEEFRDRFGPPPEAVLNLLYQVKVKLLAEGAAVASVSAENGQIAIRFRDGVVPPELPEFDRAVRAGKTALWFAYPSQLNWRALLLETLQALKQAAERPETDLIQR
jgi:transcription-repair coupling factor (superfamily II helicase)